MGGDYQFQKVDYNALDIALGDASSFKVPVEPAQTTTPKKKKSVKRKLFIEDEAEEDGQGPSEGDDDEDFKATEEDIQFIDDLIATPEDNWSQYLNK